MSRLIVWLPRLVYFHRRRQDDCTPSYVVGRLSLSLYIKGQRASVLLLVTAWRRRRQTSSSVTLITSFSLSSRLPPSFLGGSISFPSPLGASFLSCHAGRDNKSILYHWGRHLWESEETGDLGVERERERPVCRIVKWSPSLSRPPTRLLCVSVSLSRGAINCLNKRWDKNFTAVCVCVRVFVTVCVCVFDVSQNCQTERWVKKIYSTGWLRVRVCLGDRGWKMGCLKKRIRLLTQQHRTRNSVSVCPSDVPALLFCLCDGRCASFIMYHGGERVHIKHYQAPSNPRQ